MAGEHVEKKYAHLSEIIDVLNATIVVGFGAAATSSTFVEPINNNYNNNNFLNLLNMGYLNHPIMASADILHWDPWSLSLRFDEDLFFFYKLIDICFRVFI